jgi:hypothetical protein
MQWFIHNLLACFGLFTLVRRQVRGLRESLIKQDFGSNITNIKSRILWENN